ncbi:MAG: hypothetical protein K2Y39_19155 [Candidatus Obscuribacterales bacterium]|nr:hypothetical protein [Candidatus Obscuribacterales bacterium]
MKPNIDFGLCAEYSISILPKANIEALNLKAYYKSYRAGEESFESEYFFLVKHPSAEEWLLALGGICDKPEVQGVYACPSPKHFLAVIDNVAYYVDSSLPNNATPVAHSVDSIEVSLPNQQLFVVTSKTIIAIGKSGLMWESPELFPDGVYITIISKDLIWGHGDEVDGEYGAFKISVNDGSLVQNNWYTETYSAE